MRAGEPGSSRRRVSAPMAEINIVPLVDVTLVLLIIFMVTTAFVKNQPQQPRELHLNLPYSAAATVSPRPAQILVLAVDKSGQKYLGADPVATGALLQRVHEAAALDPSQRVRIDADRETPFQDVVELIELCQFEGLKNVGLHTRDEK